MLRPKQEQLLNLLQARGCLRPREMWDGLGISRQGAMDVLNPLLKAINDHHAQRYNSKRTA